MKYIILVLLLSACGKEPSRRWLVFEEKAAVFHEGTNPMINGSIETSLVRDGANVHIFYSSYRQAGGVWAKTSPDPGGIGFPEYDYPMNIPYLVFQYTLKRNGTFYMFGLRDRDIYYYTSKDGITWQPGNSGQPVLTHSDDKASIYYNLWNVGVDVDDQGVWHMLVECAPWGENNTAQTGVGLAYLTSATFNFNASKTNALAIPGGGNPHVQSIPGKGLLALHGQLRTPKGSFSDRWYISASTLPLGSSNWNVHLDTFRLGLAAAHVSDPSIVDLPTGGSLMTMSFDENAVFGVYSGLSISELYDKVSQ